MEEQFSPSQGNFAVVDQNATGIKGRIGLTILFSETMEHAECIVDCNLILFSLEFIYVEFPFHCSFS